jgi:hypothetical protein
MDSRGLSLKKTTISNIDCGLFVRHFRTTVNNFFSLIVWNGRNYRKMWCLGNDFHRLFHSM